MKCLKEKMRFFPSPSLLPSLLLGWKKGFPKRSGLLRGAGRGPSGEGGMRVNGWGGLARGEEGGGEGRGRVNVGGVMSSADT